MCALFGIYEYAHTASPKLLNRLIRELSVQSEARGKDATGFGYVRDGQIRIFKQAKPARNVHFYFSPNTACVMGHTRCATSGDPKFLKNDHPFYGRAGNIAFALAHNGVIWNDKLLRQSMSLPETNIETDSYVAVQILEKLGKVDFQSLSEMGEKIQGSFTFSILDCRNVLWLMKGDNPLNLIKLEKLGLYVYASTFDILSRSLKKCRLHRQKQTQINIEPGEILKISRNGNIERGKFDFPNSYSLSCFDWPTCKGSMTKESLDDLMELAELCGVTQEEILELLDLGYTGSEIEELLEAPDLFRQHEDEILNDDWWEL